MKYAIFADIHSNLQAYEVFILDSRKESVDKYLCIGDIVGYGANPIECVNITKDLNCVAIAGNHDLAVRNNMMDDSLSMYAREAIFWTRKVLKKAQKHYLENLPYIYNNSNFIAAHGDPLFPANFNYVRSAFEAELPMSAQVAELSFMGHTHIPAIYSKCKGSHVVDVSDRAIKISPKMQYLVNVGSVGQPRDNDKRACYCIYDNKKKELYFKRIGYDIAAAAQAILDAKLPKYLADRLSVGA
jgi:predicted phosphodiesterase